MFGPRWVKAQTEASNTGGKLVYLSVTTTSLGVMGATTQPCAPVLPRWYVSGAPKRWDTDELETWLNGRAFTSISASVFYFYYFHFSYVYF